MIYGLGSSEDNTMDVKFHNVLAVSQIGAVVKDYLITE